VRGTVMVVEVARTTAQATQGAVAAVTNVHCVVGTCAYRLLSQFQEILLSAGQSANIVGNTLGLPRPSPPLAQINQGLKPDPQFVGQVDSANELDKAIEFAAAVAGINIPPLGSATSFVTQGLIVPEVKPLPSSPKPQLLNVPPGPVMPNVPSPPVPPAVSQPPSNIGSPSLPNVPASSLGNNGVDPRSQGDGQSSRRTERRTRR
jgi:hypothetical protein